MARVFLLEPPTVNIEKAHRFGDIIILMADIPRVSALDSDTYAGTVIEKLEEEEYNPKEDFFCLVGAMSSISVSIAAMVTRWKSVKCLLFNAGRGEYVVRTLGRWSYQSKWRKA
jgi:hypothetical protein